MEKKKLAILSIVLIGIALVISLSYTLSNHDEIFSSIKQGIAPEIDYMKNMPPKPNDWGIIKREAEHKYMDIPNMNKSYWIQPDFYPSWKVAKSFYTDHDYSRWGVYGTGAFPANLRLSVLQDELNISNGYVFYTLYKAGYGIETYQGIKLIMEGYNEYFELVIEPNEILLEPTFPVFSENWVQPIKLTVVVKKIPPIGTYLLSVITDTPSPEKSREWYWQVLENEITQEDRDMVAKCKIQEAAGEKMTTNCEELILTSRKNRYMESQLFEAGNRVNIEVIVE